jgi:hypothetical protein
VGRTETDRKITGEPWSSTLGPKNTIRKRALSEVSGEVRSKKIDRAGVVRDVCFQRWCL